tara:strand:+ start:1427 stop:1798 length:372 start_codon:yes stop_codon:yes gene_type:complete
MNIGLCSGRHVVYTNEREHMDYHLFHSPVEDPTNVDAHEKVCRDFIRDNIMWNKLRENLENPSFDDDGDINLYVTGLSPLLTSFLKCWVENQERLEMTVGDLVLWHWDTETEQYIPQKWAVIT